MLLRDVKGRFVYAGIISVGLAFVVASGARLEAQGGVIRACVGEDGILRAVGPSETCKAGRQVLTWGTQGPQGPGGPAGPTGPTGPEGPAGRDGRDGTTSAPSPAIEMELSIPSKSPNASPVMAFSIDGSNSVTIGSATGGAGAGKVSFSGLKVTKMVDGLSVPLLSTMATGAHLPEVIITVFDVSGGGRVLIGTYTFETVFVASDLIGSNSSSIAEEVTFVFGKITSDVTLNGSAFHSCWDLIMNRSC